MLTAKTEEDLRLIASGVVRSLGFDTFTYGAAIRLRETWEPWFTVWTTMPQAWVAFYTRSNFIEVDPRLQAGLGRPTPLFWDRVRLAGIPGSAQFFDRAEQFGLCSGVGFYMQGLEYEHYMVSFNSRRITSDWIDDTIAGRCFIFASYFHQFYRSAILADKVNTPLSGLPLTAREQECLEYLARGLTNAQIGRSMQITERTAALHVSHILAKLRAENRTEAVALAIRLRLLPAGSK